MRLKSLTGKNLLWLPLVTTLVVSVAMVNVASASPATYFFVDPPEVSGSDPFLININVTEAPESYAWEIYLSWDPGLLDLVLVSEGDFLHRWMPNPFPPPEVIPKYDTTLAYIPLDEANADGEMMIGCTLQGDVPWASGDGWLVSFGFLVEATGSCVLDLFDTALFDHIVGGSPASTYYPNEDGFFSNVETGTISGTVTDDDTLLPIEGATVSADSYSDDTDALGFYSIWVPPGTYDVTAEMTGYEPQTVLDVSVAVGATVVQDFALTPTLGARFFVEPPEVSGSDPFLININVTEAPESYAWEIYLSWDPGLLELVLVSEGDFLHRWMLNPVPPPEYVPKYSTTLAYVPLDEANPVGEITIGCTLIGDVPWASGEGCLVSFGFLVEAEGSCVLDLFDTRLWDHMEAGSPASTYYPSQDGFFCAPSVISVYVDIKPGSWPNPLQLKSKGVLPVAVCGTEDFDVTTIDPETIRLTLEELGVGVAPLRWSYEDAATPYTGEPCSGHDLEGDGYHDLTLKFKTREVTEMLGLDAFSDRDVVILILTGNLKEEHGGTPIQGQDCIVTLNEVDRK